MSKNPYSQDSYGGKPYPLWQQSSFDYPGYYNCTLWFFRNGSKELYVANFIVSPNTLSIQRGSNDQANKTMGGWFVQRTGENPINISFGGYLLDTRDVPEVKTLLEKIENYSNSKRNSVNELYSEWTTELRIDGWEYKGFIQSVSLTKNGQSPYVYQYTIGFVAFKSKPYHVVVNQNAVVASQAKYIMGSYGYLKPPITHITGESGKITSATKSLLDGEEEDDV